MAQGGQGIATQPDVGGWGATQDLGGKDLIGGNDTKGSSLLDTIKKFINWMLGMLATIALVICLYAGFLMVTAAGDDGKYKKGMGILKQAGIGLVIIGLAWMIVSVVFWLIGSMSTSA
ncbi:MAG: pilin [Candidatus Peribacteria bacterium]|jgi:hypothetical protein|nr:pilin [Candidatus Peribacteria bacterium]